MQASQLHYYCYGCQTHFASLSSTFSCFRCDSDAIENCQSEPSSQSLAGFRPFQIKTGQTPSDQPLGILQNTVNPRRQDHLPLFTVLTRTHTIHRVRVIDLETQTQSLTPSGSLFQILQALLGDTEEGVTQQEIQKLEKVNHVSECSICQESQQENTNETDDSSQDEEKGYKLRCGHIFHEGCIKPWFEKARTCPLCRKSIAEQQE